MTSSDSLRFATMSRLFSSGVFREMSLRGKSASFARLSQLANLAEICHLGATVADGFDAAFAMLKREGVRDEYIYRAALTHKVLLGKHSLKTASMLAEFRAGNCKADLVILNGTATAYEIKSERDSLTRLMNQVANYMKVFASVNVISSDAHVNAVLAAVPHEVGVLRLSSRYQIQTVRAAINQPWRICPVTVFESLRCDEAKALLTMLGADVPDVPNTKIHATMRPIFAMQEPSAVHEAMVATLKRTRDLASLSDLVESLPRSLQAAALSVRVTKCEHSRVAHAVATSLTDAMHWI